MRKIICPDYGPPDILEVTETATPALDDGQVLVQHRAWGINYVDLLMIAGGYQLKPDAPFTPGMGPVGCISRRMTRSSISEPGFSHGKMDWVPLSIARSPSIMVFQLPLRTLSASTWLNKKLRMAEI